MHNRQYFNVFRKQMYIHDSLINRVYLGINWYGTVHYCRRFSTVCEVREANTIKNTVPYLYLNLSLN
jgi:hypothetical protein